jgi:hypothetical protein
LRESTTRGGTTWRDRGGGSRGKAGPRGGTWVHEADAVDVVMAQGTVPARLAVGRVEVLRVVLFLVTVPAKTAHALEFFGIRELPEFVRRIFRHDVQFEHVE